MSNGHLAWLIPRFFFFVMGEQEGPMAVTSKLAETPWVLLAWAGLARQDTVASVRQSRPAHFFFISSYIYSVSACVVRCSSACASSKWDSGPSQISPHC